MKLPLRYYGDPILREKALPVETITDEIRSIVANMIETMMSVNGIGLAAPQVGILLRIFVTPVTHEDANGELHYGPARAYINPIITNPSETLVEASEGCLSIPKLYAHVVRPYSIDIEALDIEGNVIKETFTGYVARNRMHENDHLNGVLFIDRIKGKKRSDLEPALKLIKQKYTKP